MFWYAKKIAMFKEKYNRFFYELLSDEFSNMIEKYFNELKNDILNYGQEKILSINKYYFNKSLYDDLFYLIDQSNKEALHLIDNINNFFNETTLILLKVNTSQLIDDSLILKRSKLKVVIMMIYIMSGGYCHFLVLLMKIKIALIQTILI